MSNFRKRVGIDRRTGYAAVLAFALTAPGALAQSGMQQTEREQAAADTALSKQAQPLENTLHTTTPDMLIGKRVVNADGDAVGEVQNVLVNPQADVVRVIVSRAHGSSASGPSGGQAGDQRAAATPELAFLPNQLAIEGDKLVLQRVLSPREMEENAVFDCSNYQPMDRSQPIGVAQGANGEQRAAGAGQQEPGAERTQGKG